MSGADLQRGTALRDAAAIQIFAAIVWLTDMTAAYAAGARWFTWRHLLPSIGLLAAAGWIAFLIALPFRRRVPIAFGILALAGAFLLWSWRLGSWPSNVAPWLLQTLAIAIVPLLVGRLNVRAAFLCAPLMVVAYHTAKSVHRGAIAATLWRELPALAVAAAIVVAIAIVGRRTFIHRRGLQAITAGGGAFLALIGVGCLIAWSGASFAMVTRGRASRREPAPSAPNIVMVVIDTLRADRLGAYGYSARSTSPFIDTLARRGDLYLNAYATTSWTVPSVATMFSGLPPEQHGVVVFGANLPSRVPTLAERLNLRGYATTAVVSNYLIDAAHGFARGFDRFALLVRYNAQTGEPSPIWIDALLVAHYWLPQIVTGGTPKPEAARVVDETLRAIEEAPRDRPLFAYVHFLDPHHPCDAPPTAATRDWKALPGDQKFDAAWSVDYDREVRYVDDQLRRFFDLAAARLGSNTIYVIVADHGEQLGEDGKRGHGSNLDDVVVRVPLLVLRPAAQPRTLTEPFSLTHLASLIESAATTEPRDETIRAHLVPPPSPEVTMTAVQRAQWKLVTIDERAARSEQLFHLPDESRNQLMAQPQIASALRTTRDAMPPASASPVIDPEARAKMRALGYIH